MTYLAKIKDQARAHLPGVILFMIFFLTSIFTYKDYGVSWDEPMQLEIGTVYYDYVVHHDPKLKTYDGREYGAGFELPLICLQRLFHLSDSRDVFLMRHFVTHLFFLAGAFCMYVLLRRLFRNNLTAALGMILFICHPRIYAHSFFNTKDIPFLAMFPVTFMLAHFAFEKNRTWLYAFLGAAAGYTAGIRLLGIILIVTLGAFLVVDIISGARRKIPYKRSIINVLAFTGGAIAALYLAWPTLWEKPIENFLWSFSTLAHFSQWGGKLLFMGTIYEGNNIPWFYVPAWIGITTPLLWLVLGATGIVLIAGGFFRNPRSFVTNTPNRHFTLYTICFFVPLTAVIVLHSILYDDWRHLYFIYPAFVLLAIYAFNELTKRRAKVLLYGLSVLQIAFIVTFMISAHPFQQVYFNRLVSHSEEYLRKNYEQDYWGCAYKQAIDYILAHDKSPEIRVFWSLAPVINNVNFLPAEQRKKIALLNRNEVPYYFITNFRTHPNDYSYPYVYYNIKVQNSSILRVYRCYKEEGQ